MKAIAEKLRQEQGSAGKVFLIILGAIVILAVAGFALWQPVIRPLVGEAIPERVSEDTVYNVPQEQPEVSFNVPAQWVVQRGFFGKDKALIQTPDLQVTIEVETWPNGTAPSLEGAMTEISNQNPAAEEPKREAIGEGILFYYIVTDEKQDTMIGALGPAGDGDVSEKANALITVKTLHGELEEYLPTLASFLRETSLK